MESLDPPSLIIASPPKPTRMLQIQIPPELSAHATGVSNGGLSTPSQRSSVDLGIVAAMPGISTHFQTPGVVTTVPQPLMLGTCSPMPLISTSNLEGELLDQALESVLSLPQVCQQVAQQQRDQCVDLKHHQDTLTSKQEELESAKDGRLQIKDDVASLQRKIYLTEDRLHTARGKSKQLKEDISDLVSRKHDLETDMFMRRTDQDRLSGLFDRYRCKMSKHSDLVRRDEETYEIYQTLAVHRQTVDVLQAKKDSLDADPDKVQRMLGGDYQIQLQNDLVDHQDEVTVLQNEAKAIQIKIDSEREEQAKLRKSTEVLHKRNAAQLTRLRKRLHEVQAQNKHWRDHAAQLRANINRLSEHNNWTS